MSNPNWYLTNEERRQIIRTREINNVYARKSRVAACLSAQRKYFEFLAETEPFFADWEKNADCARGKWSEKNSLTALMPPVSKILKVQFPYSSDVNIARKLYNGEYTKTKTTAYDERLHNINRPHLLEIIRESLKKYYVWWNYDGRIAALKKSDFDAFMRYCLKLSVQQKRQKVAFGDYYTALTARFINDEMEPFLRPATALNKRELLKRRETHDNVLRLLKLFYTAII